MPDDEDRLDVFFERNEKFFHVILSDPILPGFDRPDSFERGYLKRADYSAWEGYAADEPLDVVLQYSTIHGELKNPRSKV
jgi:hypothetical protein